MEFEGDKRIKVVVGIDSTRVYEGGTLKYKIDPDDVVVEFEDEQHGIHEIDISKVMEPYDYNIRCRGRHTRILKRKRLEVVMVKRLRK